MKLSNRHPPVLSGTAEEKLNALYSWLYVFCEELCVVSENLGYENFNSEIQKILDERRN
ncbi:MAG: hypothetical protein ACI3YE_06325 [Candidatus Avispirillum sp.]